MSAGAPNTVGIATPVESFSDALLNDIAYVRSRLDALLRDHLSSEPDVRAPESRALGDLASAFGLSSFERDLLLLCAAVELDTEVAARCEQANRHPGHVHATFALASRLFGQAHWSALLPTSPLRYWNLVNADPRADEGLVLARIRIAERVLHHVTGLVYVDEALHAWVRACSSGGDLWPGHTSIASRIARQLTLRSDPAFVLTGGDARSRRDVVAQASADAGMRLFAMLADDVPTDPAPRDRLARTWMREALLAPAVLLLEGHSAPAAAIADRIGTALVISADEGWTDGTRSFVRVEIAPPSRQERRARWRAALGDNGASPDGLVDTLATTFALTPGQMSAVIDAVDQDRSAAALWQAARLQARPALGDLAQRIEPGARWDDMVLPPAQTGLLKQVVVHVRRRTTVLDDWGFGAARRGLGLSVLFAGPSGTGKTMASEVLAHDLALDLYRIDLSQVVSKYIGETEKNLRRVFDAAEGSGAILLFDEADALFGKRSEIKDSHDRYANIEVSYLLQRMEEYRGLAILATNLRSNLDPAFLRRLRFIVDFPFPDAASRAEIWRRVFPPATPTEGLEPARLSRLNLSGGNIRNIAMNAAFMAAEAARSVLPVDVLQAARIECAKIDRPLTEAETRELL
jgi:hypothetical protein